MKKNKIIKIMKNNSGITLVALVITIVVLIILATISVNIIFGEQGIIERTKLAKQDMANAQVEEQERLSDTANSMEQYIKGERETVTIDKEEYEEMKEAIANMPKAPILLRKDWGTASITANEWNVAEEISFSEYGTGKAIVSFSSVNQNTAVSNFQIGTYVPNHIASAADYSSDAKIYKRLSTSATINYTKDTIIEFRMYADVACEPGYTYSIMLFPD